MIWRSAVNILWALVRNTLQGKHQCTVLEKMDGWGWHWECSCGEWGGFCDSENAAIKDYGRHLDPKAYRRWMESVAIEGLVRK